MPTLPPGAVDYGRTWNGSDYSEPRSSKMLPMSIDSSSSQERRRNSGRRGAEANQQPSLVLTFFAGQAGVIGLVISAPPAIAAYASGQADWLVFFTNLAALLFLSILITKLSEELANGASEALVSFLELACRTLPEFFLCLAALVFREVAVAQCLIVGSMLNRLLLLPGTAFLWGHYNNPPPARMTYSRLSSGTHGTLLLAAVVALSLPTMYSFLMASPKDGLDISRGSSTISLLVYFQYLVFAMKTHRDAFEGQDTAIFAPQDSPRAGPITVSILVVCLLLATFCSGCLVHSLHGTAATLQVNREFLSVVLLPIISSLGEHWMSCSHAAKNQLDSAMKLSLSSGCRIALLVAPLLVQIGWMMSIDLSLNVHPFQAAVLFLSVLMVGHTLKDGESTWLEGSILLTAYLAIALIYLCENGESIEPREVARHA